MLDIWTTSRNTKRAEVTMGATLLMVVCRFMCSTETNFVLVSYFETAKREKKLINLCFGCSEVMFLYQPDETSVLSQTHQLCKGYAGKAKNELQKIHFSAKSFVYLQAVVKYNVYVSLWCIYTTSMSQTLLQLWQDKTSTYQYMNRFY